MTHLERKLRRKSIAEEIKSGKSQNDIANKYGVTRDTVREACKEHDVSLLPVRHKNTFKILKLLIDGETQYEISKQFGLSRQRINQIYKLAKEAGIL